MRRQTNWVCIHTDQLTLTSKVKLHAAIKRKNKENKIYIYIYGTIISSKQKEASKSMKQAPFFLLKEPHPRRRVASPLKTVMVHKI